MGACAEHAPNKCEDNEKSCGNKRKRKEDKHEPRTPHKGHKNMTNQCTSSELSFAGRTGSRVTIRRVAARWAETAAIAPKLLVLVCRCSSCVVERILTGSEHLANINNVREVPTNPPGQGPLLRYARID